ncbi:TonB-dependent receptor plug domain-containing protein [Marinomonas sp. PE14-40]|uniref:TonB-dependent receptor plug domain-containing protein n=1 Tax=Marinomonas sp. PE14-40 TaxID=3060621 RepID=UPI003F67225C
MRNKAKLIAGAVVLANTTNISAVEAEDTIFVTAKAPIAAEEFSGSVSVVTSEQIKLSGATTVAEALGKLPGVFVGAGTGNAQNEIRIRGMAGEYGLILIDGKRVPNAERNISSSPANRSNWVSIENIERIEVIRGAASSLYGADALSGVINIITKKAGDEWRNSITVSGGDVTGDGGAYSGINLATLGKINDTFDFSLNLDQQTEDEILNSDGTSQRSERDLTNTQMKLGINLDEEERLELGVIYGEEEAKAVGDNLEQEKTLLSLDYTNTFSDFNTAVSASAGRDNVDDDGTDWVIEDKNLGFDLDGSISESQYINVGISYREESAERDNLNFSDTFKSSSLYGQDIIKLNQDNSLTLGFSFEDHNKYGSAFSPKLYWGNTLSDEWGIKLGYSEGRIAPAVREGSSDYVINAGPTRTYRGNDDLKPEDSKTTEFSVSYGGDEIFASITVFNSDVENLITTQDVNSSAAISDNVYSNVNKAEIRGLEGEISWDLNAISQLSFNYTYTDAVNKDGGDNDGKQISDRPKHVANVTYNQEVGSLDANVYVALQGVSSQYTDSANTNEIAGYSTLDLGLVKQVTDNFELSANIININDRVVLDDSNKAIHAGRELRLAITGNF